ncbi:MAG: hydroxyethylthiazole kinase [Peptococcaceae bacterium]|nr:hydroxyethylthiazole kinase [Peptococcaceae bacterium]
MFKTIFENVRSKNPLIHNITNYVTVNDCANIVIACGAAPIMADDKNEVAEITSICNGLNINIGTLNSRTIESMLLAGKKANELNHPVVLDPVGAGASQLRTDTAMQLLQEVKFTVIRGNISEIKTLASGSGTTKGVDADVADKVTEENLNEMIAFAKAFAEKTGAVIAITGAIDIVADSTKAYCIRNGHPMMSAITGTGCQLSAMTAAFVTANPDYPLEAAATAVSAMGYAGEVAHTRLTEMDGNSTYRNYIIDAIYNMTPEMLEKGAKYEVR